MISKQLMILAGQIMVMAIILSIILLFVGVGLLIFVHLCIVGRALRRGFGGNNLNSAATDESRGNSTSTTANTSMSKHDLEKLPCFDYVIAKETTTKSPGSEPADCAVCLEAFQAGEKCRLLPLCNHSFHAHCVDVWLLKTPFCPICRASAETTDMGCRLSRGREFGGDSDIELGNSGHGVELRERQSSTVGILAPELAV